MQCAGLRRSAIYGWSLYFTRPWKAAGVLPCVRFVLGECRNGCLCHPLSLSSQPHRDVAGRAEGIRCQKDQVILELGNDLVDGTPVIAEYSRLPFAEIAAGCPGRSYAQDAPQADMAVHFTSEITTQASWKSVILACVTLSLKCWPRTPVPPTAKKRKPGIRTPSGCWTLTCAGA